MKRILSWILAVALLLCCIPAQGILAVSAATAETADGLTYKVTADGTVTVTGYVGTATDVVIPATIGDRPVTAIGEDAFFNCVKLKSVQLPDSLKAIEYRAFYGCSSLSAITIPAGVTTIGKGAFYNCMLLKEVALPAGLTSIRESMFYNCYNLQSVTIPDSVTTIENYAFYTCKNLTYAPLPKNLTSIGSYAFAFCGNLQEMSIPETVAVVGECAFYYSGNLPYTIYENCKYLGNAQNPYQVFVGRVTSSQTNLTLHAKTKVIPTNAFLEYTNLISISIPEGVKNLSSGAFTRCTYFQYNVYKGGKYVGNSSNPYAYFLGTESSDITTLELHAKTRCITKDTLRNCDTLTKLVFPEGVTSIEYGAFFNCLALTSVTFPSTLTSIGDGAFAACYALEKITLPANLNTIGDRAFKECYKLTTIRIPAKVKYVGADAFSGCSKLTEIDVDSANTAYTTDAQGALLTKDEKTLVCVPSALTSYTTPSTVTTIGAYAMAHSDSLQQVTLTDSVTTIGDYAFYDSDVTTINFGKCVSAIGLYAFDNCAYLSAIHVSQENPVYSSDAQGVLFNKDKTILVMGMPTITHYTVPESVQIIGDQAFYGSYKLTEITLGSNVKAINDYAFSYCNKLSSINLNTPLESIGMYAFISCYAMPVTALPEGLKVIGQHAFNNCNAITSLTLPNSLTVIGKLAFASCTGLKNLTLGTGALHLGTTVLDGCLAVETITIPEEITSLTGWNFTSCKVLQYNIYENGKYLGNQQNPYLYLVGVENKNATEFTIHKDTKFVAPNAFNNCSSLVTLQVAAGNTALLCDEDGVLYNADKTLLIAAPYGLQSYQIPDGVTTIGDYAFNGRSQLAQLTIPDSVVTIGERAFANCTSLTELTFGSALAEIESYAFYNCTSLSTVTFTGNAPFIGENAFSGVNAIGYYPAGNATWSPDVVGNYTTYITWERKCNSHVESTDEAVAPTCTQTGLTAGSHCQVCDQVFVAQEEIPALGHSWDTGVYTEATTKADAFTTYTCGACGETKIETHEGTKIPTAENAITLQPVSVTVDSGETVQFHIETSGDVVSYKWEYRKLYKWFTTSMTGYNTATLTVPATGARNNYGYRCIVTFADGTELISEAAKLTVNTYITDIQNPNDQVVVLGYKGQFTAAATGEGIKYQWQYCRPGSEKWIDTAMEGATKPTVMIETTAARDGYMYRCKITDVTGNEMYSEVATMTVLSVKSHPVETFAATGATVQFTVEANVSEGFTYQWQYRRSATGNWSDTTLTGYNTNTLTVPAKGKNGYEYRCVLKGAKNSQIASKGAVLHVGDPVVITSQPEDVTVFAGEVATFTVAATNAYSYQWKYCRPNGSTWSNTTADGNATDTLNVTVKSNNNGYKYRCEIKGLDGTTNYSKEAILTIGTQETPDEPEGFAITQQPASLTVPAGITVQFAVNTNGTATYSWQYRKSDTASWSATSLSGNNTDTLTVGSIASRNGYQYRCVVTGSNGTVLYSDAATLTVGAEIAAQPVDFVGTKTQNAVFAVRIDGDGVTYQWQFRRTEDGDWMNTSATGNTTNTLTVSASGKNGYQYRCAITNAAGVTVYSDIATLTLGSTAAANLRFTAQPTDRIDRALYDGTVARFAVAAEGSNLKYQWQYRRSETGSWTNTTMDGNKTDTLCVEVKKDRNGYQYRCIVTDGSGNQIISDPATLTVELS